MPSNKVPGLKHGAGKLSTEEARGDELLEHNSVRHDSCQGQAITLCDRL